MIGKKTQEKHRFKIGDEIKGKCIPVQDKKMESVEFYKVSGLKKIADATIKDNEGPPWQRVPPKLEIYRERGHRRLSKITYDKKCQTCIWGCKMAVEIIIDQWNPGKKNYRFETFCYGPLNCAFYKPGPNRKVKGRKGMVFVEEDWVDEDMTSHRDPEE